MPKAMDDLRSWTNVGSMRATRVARITRDLEETYEYGGNGGVGLGMPTKLLHPDLEIWARRVTGQHRMVYAVMTRERETDIVVFSLRGRYWPDL